MYNYGQFSVHLRGVCSTRQHLGRTHACKMCECVLPPKLNRKQGVSQGVEHPAKVRAMQSSQVVYPVHRGQAMNKNRFPFCHNEKTRENALFWLKIILFVACVMLPWMEMFAKAGTKHSVSKLTNWVHSKVVVVTNQQFGRSLLCSFPTNKNIELKRKIPAIPLWLIPFPN